MTKRRNIFLLIDTTEKSWKFPYKIGYSYMNRITIDEDAGFELIGVEILSELMTQHIKHELLRRVSELMF